MTQDQTSVMSLSFFLDYNWKAQVVSIGDESQGMTYRHNNMVALSHFSNYDSNQRLVNTDHESLPNP